MMLWHPRSRIDQYLNGLLDPSRERAVLEHLAGCEACRRYFDEGVLVLRAARGDVHGPARAELERIERRAMAIAAPRPWGSTSPLANRRWVPALGLAAVAAALVLVFLSWPRRPVGSVFAAGEQLLIDGQRASANDKVPAGAVVEAVKGDSALLLDGSRGVLLRQGARARFDSGGAEATLEAGRARFSVRPRQGNFVVLAGDAQVEVHGTIFVVERTSKDETLVAVHRGKVRVLGRGSQVTLADGEESTVNKGTPSPARRARDSSLEEDRVDLLELIKRAWRNFVQSLDRAVGE